MKIKVFGKFLYIQLYYKMFNFIINYLTGYVEITCPNCQNKFYIEKSRFRSGDICCSMSCMYNLVEKK